MKKIALVFLIIANVAISQDSIVSRDLETWSSVGLQKKVADKKLALSFQTQFRLDENTSRLYQYFFDFGADYKIVKGLKAGVGYRLIKDGNKKKGFLTEHRFNFDIDYGHKLDRFKLDYRLRYQRRSNAENNLYPTTKYRLKIKADYNIKKWKYDPFISTEFFYAKENGSFNYIPEVTELVSISGIQKCRLQIGTSIKTGKVGDLKLFYMLEHQFGNYGTSYGVPINWNIIGLIYTFKL